MIGKIFLFVITTVIVLLLLPWVLPIIVLWKILKFMWQIPFAVINLSEK
jgi:hypothetical protein